MRTQIAQSKHQLNSAQLYLQPLYFPPHPTQLKDPNFKDLNRDLNKDLKASTNENGLNRK